DLPESNGRSDRDVAEGRLVGGGRAGEDADVLLAVPGGRQFVGGERAGRGGGAVLGGGGGGLPFRGAGGGHHHLRPRADRLEPRRGENLPDRRQAPKGLGPAHHFARGRYTDHHQNPDQRQKDQELDKTKSRRKCSACPRRSVLEQFVLRVSGLRPQASGWDPGKLLAAASKKDQE